VSYTIDASHHSPNFSSRNGRRISMLVLHATAGSFASSLGWLCSPLSRVSSHYLIDKGGRIFQLVADEQAAWHAGRARWRGETAINELSLGIELENANDGRDPYPKVQVDALVELARDKVHDYHIAPDMVARHLDIAVPQGRKTDPAGFGWERFTSELFDILPFCHLLLRYRVRHHLSDDPNNDFAAVREGRGVWFPIARKGAAKLAPGAVIDVDDITSGWVHLASGEGFVHLSLLEAVS